MCTNKTCINAWNGSAKTATAAASRLILCWPPSFTSLESFLVLSMTESVATSSSSPQGTDWSGRIWRAANERKVFGRYSRWLSEISTAALGSLRKITNWHLSLLAGSLYLGAIYVCFDWPLDQREPGFGGGKEECVHTVSACTHAHTHTLTQALTYSLVHTAGRNVLLSLWWSCSVLSMLSTLIRPERADREEECRQTWEPESTKMDGGSTGGETGTERPWGQRDGRYTHSEFYGVMPTFSPFVGNLLLVFLSHRGSEESIKITSHSSSVAKIPVVKHCSSILPTSNRKCFQLVIGFHKQSISLWQKQKETAARCPIEDEWWTQEVDASLAAAKEVAWMLQ